MATDSWDYTPNCSHHNAASDAASTTLSFAHFLPGLCFHLSPATPCTHPHTYAHTHTHTHTHTPTHTHTRTHTPTHTSSLSPSPPSLSLFLSLSLSLSLSFAFARGRFWRTWRGRLQVDHAPAQPRGSVHLRLRHRHGRHHCCSCPCSIHQVCLQPHTCSPLLFTFCFTHPLSHSHTLSLTNLSHSNAHSLTLSALTLTRTLPLGHRHLPPPTPLQ